MIRIVALTDAGLQLAQRIQNRLTGADIWFKPQPFASCVQEAFTAGDRLILICAMGIAVRTLAPVLVSKYEDAPVLVLDEQGQFVVPLISGHEGGANQWGDDIAQLLNAQLVITTAKSYLRPVYTVGMGCERGCPKAHLELLLRQCLASVDVDINLVNSINSIDVKADEVGLIALSRTLNKPFNTFTATELLTQDSRLSTRSEYVFKTVGVYGVAESAALHAAQLACDNQPAELVLVKQKTTRATCAIARSYLV